MGVVAYGISNMIKILERLEDYTLDQLSVVREASGASLELHGWFGGIECLLTAKPALLASGLAACIPLDVDLAMEWPMAMRVEIDGEAQILPNLTAEPRAVAALRRLQKAIDDGTARSGMDIEQGER